MLDLIVDFCTNFLDLLAGFPESFSAIHFLILFAVIIVLHVWAFSDIREGIEDIKDLLSQPKYTYEKRSFLKDIQDLHNTEFRKWCRFSYQFAIAAVSPVLFILVMSPGLSWLSTLVIIPIALTLFFPSVMAFSWVFVLIAIFTSPFSFASLAAFALFVPLFGSFYVHEIPYLIQRVYLIIRDVKDTGNPSDYYK